MSSKKSKLDLLVRVRYSNPLPAPPCPPKLLNISTNPMRYARPEFLNNLAINTPLPMIVDAECGMPLDLGKWECLWEEDADDSTLNPDPDSLPVTDSKDLFLLGDPSTSALYANGVLSAASSVPTTPAPVQVPWLRKTEYISREGVQRFSSHEPKYTMSDTIDVSPSAQIRDIEASFAASNDAFSISSIHHPNKLKVTAVDSYEIFPDVDIWANAYDLFRFSERPGERPIDQDDPRLDCAILRPMESDGDHFLTYYLTKDDSAAVNFKQARSQYAPYEVPDNPETTSFHFVRDYETVKVEQDVPNEFVLVLDDSGTDLDLKTASSGGDQEFLRRAKGAFYKNIERKMILKKKRVNAHEAYHDKWEIIKVTHSSMIKEEQEEREDTLAEVTDPTFLMVRDPDADGDPDEGEFGLESTVTGY